MAKKHMGTCLLTGQYGQFVQSHILPKALTQPEEPGRPWIQGGKGRRPTRRFDSWKDTRLVIREGENILRDLDTWAIPKLREHHLIWSGWGEAAELPAADHELILDGPNGFRRIDFTDPLRMRLFFLSLLWRSAASSLSEMADVELPPDHLDQLTAMVRDNNPHPLGFYPMMLHQFSTRGPAHNLTPIPRVMTTPDFGDSPSEDFQMIRIYFDGLAAAFYRQVDDGGVPDRHERICVGSGSPIMVTTCPYEGSFQDVNLRNMQAEAEAQHGDVLDKLAWPPERTR